MKRTIILATAVFSLVFSVHAQTQGVKIPPDIAPFVEKGAKAIALESADLNNDGLKDYILVYERRNPTQKDAFDYPANQRPLLILLRDKDNKLSAAKSNEKMVMCSQCGGIFGDPFSGISIGKNTFTVNHYGGSAWRWTADYKFNYSRIDKTWQLVEIEKTSYHNVRPMKETLKKTVLTPKDFGKIDIADFDPSASNNSYKTENRLITATSIGNVKLGMTVADVRKIVKPMVLKRTSDGEGIALIEVMHGKESLMTIYAGEEDPAAPIDEKADVEMIETFNSKYSTAEGVKPKMSLDEVSKVYGSVKEIILSPIEAREYAKFAKEPNGIIFRVSGKGDMAGKYEKGISRANKYNSGAYLFSISIVGGAEPIDPPTSSKGVEKKVFTGFLKEKGDKAEFAVRGKAGYRMTASIIDVESPDKEGPVMIGYVTYPNGDEDGNAGGIFFEDVLKETGDYKILIKQNEAKSGAANIKFKLRVLLEKVDAGFAVLDIAAFNKKIDKAVAARKAWVKMPFQVVANIIEPFSEMKSRTVKIVSPFADVTDRVTVTIIDDGYADDSVRGEKFVFVLKVSKSGVWKVDSAKKAQVCQKNRGHQNYSVAPCI